LEYGVVGIDTGVDDRDDDASTRRERPAVRKTNRRDGRLGEVLVPDLIAVEVHEAGIGNRIEYGDRRRIELKPRGNFGRDGEAVRLDAGDFGIRADRIHQRLGDRHAGIADDAVGNDV
jgi:hypothetical protein